MVAPRWSGRGKQVDDLVHFRRPSQQVSYGSFCSWPMVFPHPYRCDPKGTGHKAPSQSQSCSPFSTLGNFNLISVIVKNGSKWSWILFAYSTGNKLIARVFWGSALELQYPFLSNFCLCHGFKCSFWNMKAEQEFIFSFFTAVTTFPQGNWNRTVSLLVNER